MPRGKKTTKIETTAESYDHKQETPLRPDIGLQAQFKQKRDPKKYRYDSSLSPELSWDINAERERAEALIAKIHEAKTLEEAKSAASALSISQSLSLTGRERLSAPSLQSPRFPYLSMSASPQKRYWNI